MKNISTKKGFTLIELLIVITIIGILAVALLPSVLGAPARARDAARKADLNNIVGALEMYNSDHQGYPTSKICFGTTSGAESDAGVTPYLTGQKSPLDPQGSNATHGVAGCAAGQYAYCPAASPYNYFVIANMEVQGDGTVTSTSVTDCTALPNPATHAAANGDSAWFVSK